MLRGKEYQPEISADPQLLIVCSNEKNLKAVRPDTLPSGFITDD
ncbi:hypothetical protein [Phocaeicola sp.]|nr:hypothetical protein [Phocaeicola sp.]